MNTLWLIYIISCSGSLLWFSFAMWSDDRREAMQDAWDVNWIGMAAGIFLVCIIPIFNAYLLCFIISEEYKDFKNHHK